jgi:hypothetical protein
VQLTIVYITGRQEPHLEWMVEDLRQQKRPDDEIHLVVVDTFSRTRAGLGIASDVFRSVTVTPPKPNIWQGASSCDVG